MIKSNKAFTLIEIVIAMGMLMVVVLSIFLLNQSANKSSMDAYYEMVAFSLAREPIEILRGFGYESVDKIYKNEISNPAAKYFKIGSFKNIENDESLAIEYPIEAERFQRRVLLDKKTSSNGVNYIKISVTVAPKGLTPAEILIRKKDIVDLESSIMETPKW